MERHYFLSSNVDDLEAVERELEVAGIGTPQIHVLSRDEATAQTHDLHPVGSFTQRDIVHSTEIGAAIGAGLGALVLFGAGASGIVATTGWLPWGFLAAAAFGFMAWQGGLFGIQVTNERFRRFEPQLAAGRHLLFVEANPAEEPILKRVFAQHPGMEPVGDEHVSVESRLVITVRRNWKRFLDWAP